RQIAVLRRPSASQAPATSFLMAQDWASKSSTCGEMRADGQHTRSVAIIHGTCKPSYLSCHSDDNRSRECAHAASDPINPVLSEANYEFRARYFEYGRSSKDHPTS